MSKRALVVEDDANISELLRLYLGKDGFDVMQVADGAKAESSFGLFTPDVVLLDIMLPGKDGMEICRSIRAKSSVPIIMLTAKGETSDKISGLDIGADDYVTKPFDVKELLARIHAVMRRTDADSPVEKKLEFDKLVINLDSYELIVDGNKIDTPPKRWSCFTISHRLLTEFLPETSFWMKSGDSTILEIQEPLMSILSA